MKKLLLAAMLAVFFIAPACAEEAVDANAPTAKITAASSSDRVALPGGGGGRNIIVSNDSDRTCFIRTGSSTVTALTTHFAILQGSIQRFSYEPVHTYIAAICNSGVTGTIYISQGPGE